MNLVTEILYESFVFGITAAITATFLAPLQFMKIIRQETLDNYRDIARDSFSRGKFKIFFRGAVPYAVLQFVSSAAFGVSNFTSGIILEHSESFLAAVLVRSLLGGALETAATISTEVREISRNKGELMQSKGRASSIVLPIWIRNSIFWFASALSFEIYKRTHITSSQSAALAFLLGVVAGVLSIPPDLLATQSCGAAKDIGIMARFRGLMQINGVDKAFAGAKIRIIQIALFSLVTECVMTAMNK